MRLTLITLALLLLILTACSDPLGYVQAEQIRANAQVQTAQIQADAQTEQARIDATTARVRIGGWMTAAGILAIAVVLSVLIVGMIHLQAQRDRLIAQGYQLPAQQTRAALGRPPSKRPTLARRTDPDGYTLSLPERSNASTHEIVVIDG